jgi:hypothetical protein
MSEARERGIQNWKRIRIAASVIPRHASVTQVAHPSGPLPSFGAVFDDVRAIRESSSAEKYPELNRAMR